MTALLEIDTLTGGYRDTKVLFDVSAHIEAGSVLGVFGRNGVGKTTLARLVQGGLHPVHGDIRLNGRSVGDLPAHARRGQGIGYMPQTSMVFDDLTVRENLTLGNAREETETYFDRFPRLAERLDQPAGTMSGGERKILAFVRTMIEDTQVIILDEPSEGVQPENIDHMAECLKERALAGAGILLCEQNLSFLTGVSNWFLGLDAGRVVLNKLASEVPTSELRSILSL
ncbi:ATP-binding cassette domain-containing protein [Ruegeria pomeroyi]|uniref:ATP-binding cassette domain-containing protein n=1 Tax=Ruegeria alba TaxID=2916756 RepID=A0ABS9P0Z4_9RHOB|nr:ATP-binding cassette domain-containing protein [Ruegeria alba]MCE8522025.1 ATP-binding cassette domain-containing protein [Ruegeria pomeroyi]MCE8535643.1 ATP-binding cassette domain-containing protein [Ruegeria pomeroyi]MCG6560159.1 ATP-binding cassette domain-containing protein [Ruegeria alba]